MSIFMDQELEPVSPMPRALHVGAAAAASMLALENGQRGLYNVAEPSGYLLTDNARRELGFDPSFRLAKQVA